MCKYCEYNHEFAICDDEKHNGNQEILGLINGNQRFSVILNRYECDDDKNTELILYYGVDSEHGDNCLVSEKHINIKYCPFCGEKL